VENTRLHQSITIGHRQTNVGTLAVNSRTIEHGLSVLKKMNILKHKGKDNAGMWVVFG